LVYRRTPDSHGYIHRRGEFSVVVIGGVSVDRQLLRQAAVATRAPTEAELLRALPPAPSHGLFDKFRDFLGRLLRGLA